MGACHHPACACDDCHARRQREPVTHPIDFAHALRCPCPKCASKNAGPAASLALVEALLDPRSGPMISPDQARQLLGMPDVPPPALTKGDGFAAVSGITAAANVTAGPNYVAIGGDLSGPASYGVHVRPVRPRMLLVDRLGFERIQEYTGGHRHIVAAQPGGIGAKHIEVTFEQYGETTRNGERLVEFREVSEHAAPQWFVEPPFPTVDALARAIFDTDPDVRSFISGIADNVVPLTETRWSTALGRSETVAVPGVNVAEIRKWDPKLLQRAWDRDEQGWRARATLRAKNVLRALRGEL